MIRKTLTGLGALAALWAAACTAPNPAYRPPRPGSAGAAAEPALPDARAGAGDPRGPAADAAPLFDTPPAPSDLASPALPRADAPRPADAPAPPADAARDSQPPLSGLVAYWRLDRTGGSYIPDDTGANQGALLPGASWTDQGYFFTRFSNGGALELGGAGAARLGTATIPGLGRPKTISLWFWLAAPAGSGRRVLLALANPGQSRGTLVGLEGGRVAVWGWNQLIGTSPLYGPAPAGPGWHHVGYTFDGSQQALYLLGTRAASAGGSTDQVPVTDAFLGAFSATNPMERFQGRIDDVRIYDRALDWTQMAELAAGRP